MHGKSPLLAALRRPCRARWPATYPSVRQQNGVVVVVVVLVVVVVAGGPGGGGRNGSIIPHPVSILSVSMYLNIYLSIYPSI
jgi:hypothetical protein